MTDPDILTRLRESDGGYFMRQMFTEAADEIERLRKERDALFVLTDRLTAEHDALRAERDEARRSVCELSIQLGGVYRRIGGKIVEVTTAEGCAAIMRWDCFKENTNDR